MDSGWRYRVASVTGVVVLTALAVTLVNNATVQSVATMVPLLDRLSPDPPVGPEFAFELLIAAGVFAGAFLPLYKPRPRRILDTISLVQKRVFVAVFALATIGYFDYSYQLPRLTVLLMTPLLLIVLPAWFVWIRQRPSSKGERTLVVGDNLGTIDAVAREVDGLLLGYLCPTSAVAAPIGVSGLATDGGESIGMERLGGLSRIEDVLVEYDVGTVVLAFGHADRAEFFGALDACYEHGVNAKVHRDHTDSVLVAEGQVGPLVDVEIEPWDVQDYLLKRAFDIVFAVGGLVVLSPVIVGIALAIKLDDGGSVLYQQERTAVFGETFDVYKFRSMTPEGESATPIDDGDNDRITGIGQVLRQTHLDEIPQLWSILKGDMSVVGPRAVWTDEEALLEAETQSWRQRWFVKPGLTGLAQVNNVKSTNPTQKHQLDLKYIREQSFWFDTQLVVRQVWKVGVDVYLTLQ
ncbi:sugar transferase [Halomicroarcula limicola]|uniref:Sugar transferase n=1 Tax=Haloarcula limicola TaxID=1429915 RepID=A0A8J7YEW5_9EURY|nr:sugar transferase [Halomicroarcula limicola]MBV0925223.1 sugar transferase [Halomicroarcula limicola]